MSPANLGGACDSCCCPEMQCCTPTTLLITVSGFSGTSVSGDYPVKQYYSDPYPGPINTGDFGYGIPNNSTWVDMLSRAGGTFLSEFYPEQLNYPKILEDYFQEQETYPVIIGHDFTGIDGSFSQIITPKPGQGTSACFSSANDCESFPHFCETPPTEQKTYPLAGTSESITLNAPVNPHVRDVEPGQWVGFLKMEYDEDRNGVMVSTRTHAYYNPNIKYTITRQNEPVDGQKDAVLLYEVEKTRNPELTLFQNEPTVVDYRCTPRNVPSADDPTVRCLAPIGYAKPHICAYSGTGNYSADVRVRLCPYTISTWDMFPWPATWRVCGLEILSPGSGYSVGDMIYCGFCPSPLFGGEFYVNQGNSSFDEGGYGFPLEYNRFVITAVDENGGIVSVYLLRTFYIDPVFGETEFVMEWGRQLCHAQSVLSGGSNYSVGDEIAFQCVSTNCEAVEDAIAYVADVDENGAILDWSISGSDAWKSYGLDFCPTATSPDKRGKYKWNTVHVCSTVWTGIAPVRRAFTGQSGTYNWKPPGSSTPDYSCRNQIETRITSIDRVLVDTAVNIICSEDVYPYILVTMPLVMRLFPPFPPCGGGGAAASPVINIGGNGSTLEGAGSIASVTLDSPGSGYSFRERRHVAPTLPTTITGGAEFAYTFEVVEDYPVVGLEYLAPYGYQIPADRYAYFYVSDIDIVSGGSGYEVGQEFYIGPSGAISNNDIPEDCPNGTWYDGARAATRLFKYDWNLDDWVQQGDDLYWKQIPNDPNEYYILAAREPRLHITVTAVDENGAITAVEITHGGTMYRTEWADWKQHPLLYAFVSSNTGYGCVLSVQAAATEAGGITSISVAPSSGPDPEHEGETMPTGGRDYMEPEAGYIWKINTPYPALAGNDLGVARFGGRSTHIVVRGSLPPFVPPSRLYSTKRCPNDLINRTYEIYRVSQQDFIEGEYKPSWALGEGESQYMGEMGTGYVVLESIFAAPGVRDTVEYGMTITLAPADDSCPDLDDGVP